MALKFIPVDENTTVDFYSSHASTFNSFKYLCGKQEKEKEKYETFLYTGDGMLNRVLSEEFDIKDLTKSVHVKNTCKCQNWDMINVSNHLPINLNNYGDTYLVLMFSDEKDTNTLANWFKSVKDLIWK